MVNGFGEARSEARRAKVGGRERGGVLGEGAAPPATWSGERCKLPQRRQRVFPHFKDSG